MTSSNRSTYIQDQLAAQQNPVNASVYTEKFGLFLNDDQASELEAAISCDNHQPCGDSLMPGSYGYHRSIVKNVNQVRALFTQEAKGLMVLHIGQQHSFSRLKITRPCFEQLLRSGDIFHALKDNVLHIGFRTMEIEIAPPAPTSRFLYDNDDASSKPCGSEIAYGLRFIEANGKSTGDPWSLRQCVIYNKTHETKKLSRWAFFSLPKVLREQLDHSLNVFQCDLVLRPFDIHLLVFSTTVSMWRPYFVYIVHEIESFRQQCSMSDPRTRDHESWKAIDENTFIILKDYETDMLNAILAIRATKRTLAHHQKLYQKWFTMREKSNGNSNETPLDLRFFELSQNVDGVLDQAQSLLDQVRSIKEIVANFLTLASSYSAENIARQSKRLAELSQIDSSRMKKLTEIAQKDTKAVKALSVVTLIYLPTTVVFNFFSTSFVSWPNGDIQVTEWWWLLVVTSLPLTLLTLMIWIVWTSCVKLRNSGSDLELGLDQSSALPNTETSASSSNIPSSHLKA